jgi:hypothetical protein
MPLTKRKQHLRRAGLKAAEVRKRQKLEREAHREPEYQKGEQEDDSKSNDSSDSSSNDFDFDSDSGNNDSEVSLDENNPAVIKWTNESGKSLHVKGTGSRTTQWREEKRGQELQKAASGSLNIAALFQRQRDLKQQVEAGQPKTVVPLDEIKRAIPEVPAKKQEIRLRAAEDLKRLIDLKTEQEKKYGYTLSPKSNFYHRHTMILSFLWIQQQRETYPNCSRRNLAEIVASNYNKAKLVGRRIIRWERSWVADRIISESKAGGYRRLSLLNDEEIFLAVREFTRSHGEGQ